MGRDKPRHDGDVIGASGIDSLGRERREVFGAVEHVVELRAHGAERGVPAPGVLPWCELLQGVCHAALVEHGERATSGVLINIPGDQ